MPGCFTRLGPRPASDGQRYGSMLCSFSSPNNPTRPKQSLRFVALQWNPAAVCKPAARISGCFVGGVTGVADDHARCLESAATLAMPRFSNKARTLLPRPSCSDRTFESVGTVSWYHISSRARASVGTSWVRMPAGFKGFHDLQPLLQAGKTGTGGDSSVWRARALSITMAQHGDPLQPFAVH